MKRRDFLRVAGATGAAASLGAMGGDLGAAQAKSKKSFKLKYAPHFNQFRRLGGRDLIGQLQFMRDEGFRAFEDNGLARRSVETQEAIGKELDRLDMEMGVFVASADFETVDFASTDDTVMEPVYAAVKNSVEVAKRVNAKWCTIVPGRFDPARSIAEQTPQVIEHLKRCADLLEPAGLIAVLEPLNALDHPGMFLTRIPQAHAICKAVDSPSIKILDDFYHQQITEGDLIRKMDAAWDEIAYLQIGDNPGRYEPTTGEINYKNIFKHVHEKGYTGVLGMEHGIAKRSEEGEQAVIDAYRACDDF